MFQNKKQINCLLNMNNTNKYKMKYPLIKNGMGVGILLSINFQEEEKKNKIHIIFQFIIYYILTIIYVNFFLFFFFIYLLIIFL